MCVIFFRLNAGYITLFISIFFSIFFKYNLNNDLVLCMRDVDPKNSRKKMIF